MFEIISNPFENVGESLSGLAIEKAIEVVTPSISKGCSWGRFLIGLLIIVFGVGLCFVCYYSPKKKEEEERLLKESKKIKE